MSNCIRRSIVSARPGRYAAWGRQLVRAGLWFVGLAWAPLHAEPAGLSRAEFAPASTRAGSTLFTRMDEAATGLKVQNPYDDPSMWGSRYREYMGGSMGSGVAIGDFDQDGKIDLYASTKTSPGRLFRNLGGWRFEDVTDRAGLGEPTSLSGWLQGAVSSDKRFIWRQGAVFADVNNDGRPDLFICRNNAPNLLYLNQGDGTFKEEAEKRGLAIVDGSVIGAFADYDRDGWLDVLVLMNQADGTEPAGRTNRLFRNTGNGFFTEVTATAGVGVKTFGHAALWFDYDGDRWPDLYIGDDFSGPDYLFRNNHDGTFTEVLGATMPHTPFSSMGADVADIDNDGHFDVLVADMATTSPEKDRRGLAASRNDVITAGTKDGVAPQYTRNALLLNTGRGYFREAACWAGVAGTDWTWSVRFEDFDHDGWQDLHLTNGMVREANNSDLLAEMMRALSDSQRIATIKRSPELNEPNLAYRNRHGEGFEPVTDEWGLGEVGVTFGAATADFDGDGDLDLAYLNYNGGLSVYRNDVAGRHRVEVRLQGTKSNRFGVGAVVRLEAVSGPQTRAFTVARGYASGSELVAHFGLGDDTRIKRLVVEWPSGLNQVFTDLAVDCAYRIREDAAASVPDAAPVPALFADRSAELGLALRDAAPVTVADREQIFLPFRTDRRGPGLAVADVDGDGQDEIYLSATPGSPARLLRRAGATYVASAAPDGVPAGAVEDGPPLFFDANGDGAPDLLVTRASAQSPAWPDAFHPILYANDGHGRFTATDALPDITVNAGAVVAADLDGDGDLDLLIGGRSVPGRYPEKPRSYLLRNDAGRFVDITGESAGLPNLGLVNSALFRDVDGDGRPDLLVALEWDCVRCYHNDGGGRFSDWTEQLGFTTGGRGWWNSLASADFNGDGRPDFAAGNLGLNTTYQATATHPAVLYYGDFAQNGTRLLAEAGWDGDKLIPLRPRVDLGARLPVILRRYPKNNAFAKAGMAEVFGAKALAAAERFEADNFTSGVFLSQPDGTYRFAPFPRVAQIGSMQGMVATDLDGDGFADLCAVQNSDAAIPRFDGGVGVFLRGRGDGAFELLTPAAAGVVVPGNGRAVAIISTDGGARPDLLVTRHGDSTLLLANTAASTSWYELRLQGAPGNPDAVGARVQVVYSNQPSTYHEIGLGGGWFSQSAPRLQIAAPRTGRLVEALVTWPDGHASRHPAPSTPGRWLVHR